MPEAQLCQLQKHSRRGALAQLMPMNEGPVNASQDPSLQRIILALLAS